MIFCIEYWNIRSSEVQIKSINGLKKFRVQLDTNFFIQKEGRNEIKEISWTFELNDLIKMSGNDVENFVDPFLGP
jgi:hypothetical protein